MDANHYHIFWACLKIDTFWENVWETIQHILRFCMDFSKVNSISAFNPYPMPRVDELMERLGKAQYLSTLHMCKGYWQVPLTPEAQELTAFRAPTGLFQFTTMPFGFARGGSNLPAPNGSGAEMV